ncbi:hypothetical protein Tco_0506870, partial [Tanacetum coccineum]
TKGETQTITPTLPKSQGPEASGAPLRKKKQTLSKKPPTEAKVTPPLEPTEKPDQSQLVFSAKTPNPKDSERNIQLADSGLPSTTLNDSTYKSQALLEWKLPDPKDPVGNK